MDWATALTSSARVTSKGKTSGRVISTGKTSALPDVLSPMRFAASARMSSRRPEIASVQPSAAKASAPASPMPLPPPVTQATRFARDVINTSMDTASLREHSEVVAPQKFGDRYSAYDTGLGSRPKRHFSLLLRRDRQARRD